MSYLCALYVNVDVSIGNSCKFGVQIYIASSAYTTYVKGDSSLVNTNVIAIQ